MVLYINNERALVVNPLTGATLVAETHWWRTLGINWLEGRLDPRSLPTCYDLTSPYASMLEDLGFLLTPQKHAELTGQLVDFGNRFRRERQTTFFITPQTQQSGCPLTCGYCFQKSAEPERELLLSSDGTRAVIDYVKRYQREQQLPPSKICLQLFGGEPVQNRFYDLWESLLAAVRKGGWRWAVVTSGATLTANPRLITLFEGYRADGLQEFNITVDGLPQIHDRLRPFKGGSGTFQRIEQGVDMLLDQGLPVLLKTNLGKDNIGHYRGLLDFVMDKGWHRQNLVVMINIIQAFGGVETNQQVSEEILMCQVVEILRDPKYSQLLPIIRLEGKKLTGYLANCFSLPVPGSDKLRRGKPVFDGYPYHAFCNPTKGTSWNISPDGQLRSCNWMDGHEGLEEGTIFSSQSPTRSQFARAAIEHPHCSGCDINTLCGGGCPVDMHVRPEYYQTCRQTHGAMIEGFVQAAVAKGWLSLDLDGQPFRLLRTGFDLNYTYRDRSDPQLRISHAGCLQ